MSDLYKAFHENFEIIIADTPQLREEVYRIRYQVLCVEKRFPGFEQSLCSDGKENDSYDSHSSHALLRYSPSGKFIGTVRLVLFDTSNPDKLLPVEEHGQFDPKLCDMSKLSRQHTAEISRFFVVGQFARRRTERRNLETRKSDPSMDRRKDRRSTPNLALLLAAGVLRMCAHYDVRNWLSFMDPALNRLLDSFGLGFNPAGPISDYYGVRQAYFMKIADALSEMKKKNYDAWEVVTDKGKYSRFLAK